jgi:hypothetical protein
MYSYSNTERALATTSHALFAGLFSPFTSIVHCRNSRSSPLHPHLLQVPDDSHVGIHVAVDAVLHAGVLVALERTGGHATSNALLEADGVELVDGCYDKSV